MSYVDALYDRAKDRIHVVERVNGVENTVTFPQNMYSTTTTPRANIVLSLTPLLQDSLVVATKNITKN